jgi:hypothetical protein
MQLIIVSQYNKIQIILEMRVINLNPKIKMKKGDYIIKM